MSGLLHAVSILGICLGVAALFWFAWLDDRERREDGLPVLEEDLTSWRDWSEVEWRWPR